MSEFLIKPKVYFGTDALQSLNTLNARRVFVVTDQAMVKFGFAEQVLNLLEKRVSNIKFMLMSHQILIFQPSSMA